MVKRGGVIRTVLNYFFSPRPSLFDLCVVVAVAGMGFMPVELRGFYFCFTAIFLTVVGFYQKNKREFPSPGLTLLALLALMGVFLHSFKVSSLSITFEYLNFYLMFEGFGYVFFGCLLFSTLVTKSKNIRLIYIALPFALQAFIGRSMYCGRGSIIFAMGAGYIIYMLMRSKLQMAILTSLVALNVLAWNFEWFAMKWSCRIPIWWDTITGGYTFPKVGILQHPFIGNGFNKLLVPDNMLVVRGYDGLLNIHNDYLNAANILGALVLIPLGMLLFQIYKSVRGSRYLAPVLGIGVLCFVQMTMFSGEMALAIIAFLALAIIESRRKLVWIY